MTTLEAISIGFREARRVKRADALSRAGTRDAPSAVGGFLRRLGTAFFTLCALGAFCYAAFSAAEWAGWVVLGVSLLVAEWRLSPPDDDGSTRSG